MDSTSESPYADAIAAWLASNRQDSSLLLRGQALQDARGWAQATGENLSHQELEFLYASLENALEARQKPSWRKLTLPPLLRNFKRKAFLIIGITGVVSGTAFCWTKITVPPEYEGNFRLLVDPVTNEARVVEPSALARSQEQAPSKEMSNLDYATLLEILKSPRMLSQIYEKVRKYPDLNYFALEKGLTVERLFREKTSESTLTVERLFGGKSSQPTKILEVRFAGKDPKQVKFVLNVVAKEYLEYSLTARRSRIQQGAVFIDDQLRNELNPRVNELRTRLQTLEQQYNYKPNSEPRVAGDYILARQYSDIQEQLEFAERKRNQLLEKREILRDEAAQKQYPWELIALPGIPTDSDGNLIPASGNSKNIHIGGVVLGLLLGVGAAVLLESKDSSRRYSYQRLSASSPNI